MENWVFIDTLLLGTDIYATNGIDIGYDALLADKNKEDMYWLIENESYVIQGVKSFEKINEYPFGVEINESGLIGIEIEKLENIDEDFKVYLYDKLVNQTYLLNDQKFEVELEAGLYHDRFEIAFQSTAERLEERGIKLQDGFHVFMNNSSSELHINKYLDTEINNVMLTNYLGQTIKIWHNNLNISRSITLPVHKIATGVYFVQLNTETGRVLKKIIVE